MAEALGIISSILAILDAIKATYKKVNDAARLPKAFQKIISQTDLAWDILAEVEERYTIEEARDQDKIHASLKVCEEDVKSLQTLYDIVCNHADGNWMSRYKRHISNMAHDRPRKAEELWKRLLETLQVLTSYHIFRSLPTPVETLETAIEEIEDTEDSLPERPAGNSIFEGPVGSVHSGSGPNHSSNSQFIGGTHNHGRQGPTMVERCRSSLMKDMTSYISDLAEKKGRTEGSCEWILSRPEYIAWTEKHGIQLLNVIGEPGIGKSAIAAFLVEHFSTAIAGSNVQCHTSFARILMEEETRRLPS